MGRKNKNKRAKQSAIVDQFNNYYGSGSLEDWQRLCFDIGLEGDFSSKTKCRNAIRTVHVNIWDLLDAVDKEPKQYPRRFPNAKKLADYTVDTGRIYPKKHAKDALGPARALLRHIF
ncbi:hypothetical protein QBC43DRAFT_2438 [Cladorrhinum sp. PSN259]|nr:hypothetical protein QBC43DRAFT_2438 [Cladorrhinum sp. PSN259]